MPTAGYANAFWGKMEVRFGKDRSAICLRHASRSHSGKDGSANAYGRLRQRILGKDRSAIASNLSILALAAKTLYNRSKIKSIEFMSTYNEVLNQVQSLPISEQLRLLKELKKIEHQGVEVEVEGDLEVITAEEIAESEAAWQDYLAGRDRGISSKELKLKLFGEKID